MLASLSKALEGGHRATMDVEQLLKEVKQLSVTELGARCSRTKGTDETYIFTGFVQMFRCNNI